MLERLLFVLSGCVSKSALHVNSNLIAFSIIVIKKTATAPTIALISLVNFNPFHYFHHV